MLLQAMAVTAAGGFLVEAPRDQDGLTQMLLSSSLRSAVVHLHSSEEEGPSGSIGAVTLISGPDGRGATFSLRESRVGALPDFKGEKHGMILNSFYRSINAAAVQARVQAHSHSLLLPGG